MKALYGFKFKTRGIGDHDVPVLHKVYEFENGIILISQYAIVTNELYICEYCHSDWSLIRHLKNHVYISKEIVIKKDTLITVADRLKKHIEINT